VWLAVFLVVFAWSAINPEDPVIWVLEVLPAAIALILLSATWRPFPLTRMTYWLILLHAVVLMVGGHYTYERVPLFDWIRDIFDLTRNNYDKLGHFMQGFVPAIVAREILLRKTPLRPGGWLFAIVVCVCLAISACYELVEWVVALAMGQAADAFLGTQGYVWDTQSDMAWALAGAIVAQLLLSKHHARQLDALRTGRQ